jgi:hypothetical protein
MSELPTLNLNISDAMKAKILAGAEYVFVHMEKAKGAEAQGWVQEAGTEKECEALSTVGFDVVPNYVEKIQDYIWKAEEIRQMLQAEAAALTKAEVKL